MPNFFTDNMVLQRNSKIPVWGFANAGEKVTVQFKNQTKTTVTNANGKWILKLNPEKAGGPFEMKIKGENEIILKNILIGDVWLASGQSNMEWNLARSEGYENELNQTVFPQIRQIKIKQDINTLPQNNVMKTEWKVADANSIGDFSGVAYFFAKKIYNETKIPVGIINSTWGGTNIETWISREAFENSPGFKEMISKMPKISLDELLKYSSDRKSLGVEKKLKSKVADFNAVDFLKNDFNDSKLYQLNQPEEWEAQGFESLDGIVWLRKSINLTDADLNSDAQLSLSKIDDEDLTYFNGTQVGSNNAYDTERVYTIPKTLLKPGKNVIVIKITDNGGGGGIWGDKNRVKITTSDRTLSLAGNWGISLEKIQKKINENEFPSLVYNAMIAPLVPYSIKGFIWYQGESNAHRAVEYKKSFPLLIEDWRGKFGKQLPFYFVQLSTYKTEGNNSNEGSMWAEIREAQTQTFLKTKNTGMAVTTDVGNPLDIHPRNKKMVGERLAFLHINDAKVSPVYKKYKIEGNKIIISFSPAKRLKQNGALNGFEVAGADHIFYPAKGKTVNNTVQVSSENVVKPVAVRYGWKGDDSEINLFTEDGFPVSPFRTDDFKLITEGNKYQINIKE